METKELIMLVFGMVFIAFYSFKAGLLLGINVGHNRAVTEKEKSENE